MTTKSLLVELLAEELPPKALHKLGEAFAHSLAASLKAQGLAGEHSAVTPFATPRRLAVHVSGVRAVGEDAEVIEKLMPSSIALRDGLPTDALRKRLSKMGRSHLADLWPDASDGPDRLYEQGQDKAKAIYFKSLAKGTALTVGLQNALDAALAALPIPKLMSYQLADGWTSVHFARPVHGLVALHGADVVPVQALGLAAGRSTRGHRFEAPIDPVMLQDADHYAQQLERQGAVVAGFGHRRAEIARQLHHAAAMQGLTPIDDDALLDEVTALVERPNVLLCRFEREFLSVPPECLILTMKANQKYFPLLDGDGRLTEKFLVVSNLRPADPGAIIEGNQRVVRPRLADAKFFFDQDRKKRLEDRLPQLDRVVYHGKLGSQGERSVRVSRIAVGLAVKLWGKDDDQRIGDVADAARLAKADLVTDMVGEFPELQGVMGGYYARHDGAGEAVAIAIEDHYKPRFAGDALPRNEVGVVVALADKLETLAGLFGIGEIPTGDRDPYALRRQALGAIRMLVERELALSLHDLINLAYAAFPRGLIGQNQTDLSMFIFDRFAGLLRERGYSAAEVSAVLAMNPDQFTLVPKQLDAVRSFAAMAEAPALASANKRVANILRKAEGDVPASVDASLLQEPAEQALDAALKRVAPEADAAFACGDYTASLRALAALKAPVDAFFDGVMVNTDDAALRANRLALLASLHAAMNRIADLSKLAT